MNAKRFFKLGLPVVIGILLSGLLPQTTRGAALSVSFSGLPSGSAEDLTSDGSLDWAHWGLASTNSFDHKSSVPPLIGNYSVIGANPAQQTNNVGVGYSWSDGTPTASAANSTTALLMNGVNNGFQFQVTADTNLTRLLVFVGSRAAQGKLQLHLSDSSVGDYVDTSLDVASGETNGFYTIDFAAAAAGQTLTVTFTLRTSYDTAAAVLLHAAAAQYGPFNFDPSVSLTSPTNDELFAWPATVNFDVEADDFDGSIREIQFFVNNTLVATKTNFPYTYAWSGAAPGAYTIVAAATDNLGGTAVSEPATIYIYTNNGALSASVAVSPASVDLAAQGARDWVHWGLYRESSYNHKFGVTTQIGNYTNIGYNLIYALPGNATSFSWTDGAPTPAVTNTTTGLLVQEMGNGYEFNVGADTNLRTLKVYVGNYASRIKLRAILSDVSASPVSDSSVMNVNSGPDHVYTVNYRAGMSGQTLKLQLTIQQPFSDPFNADVRLLAATLVTGNVPPQCAITNLTEGAVLQYPTNLTIKASVSDSDGSVTNVSFYDGTNKIGQATSAPYQLATNLPAGAHTLTVRATDNSGDTFTSHEVNIFIITGGGTLSGSRTTPTSGVDLSAEGRTDWAHWGLLNPSNFNHRADVPQRISDVTKIGSAASFKRLTDYGNFAVGFSWTNGTPTASATSSSTGIYIERVGHGFQITAPADTYLRRLKVYVGAYASLGKFEAWLSDASAVAYSDRSVSNLYDNTAAAYTLDYAAASSSNTLTVKFTALENFDAEYGNVTFEAAALSLLGVPLLNPQYANGNDSFVFVTEPGVTYLIQRSPVVPATNWVTIQTILGDGGITNIVDATASEPQNFYRVLAN